VLDREQRRAQLVAHPQLGRTAGEPARRHVEQADQVVGILGAQVARRLEAVALSARERGQRRPVGGRQVALIVERAVELLEVVAGAALGVLGRRPRHGGGGGEAGGDGVERLRRIGGEPLEHQRAVIGEALVVLEPLELRDRVAAEGTVDLLRHEGVAHVEQHGPHRVAHVAGAGREQHLERVRIGAQRLAHRLAGLPVRPRRIERLQVERRLGEPGLPRERQHEDAATILVAAGVIEPPRARADHGVDDDSARPPRRSDMRAG
jgi:hypothetical protein